MTANFSLSPDTVIDQLLIDERCCWKAVPFPTLSLSFVFSPSLSSLSERYKSENFGDGTSDKPSSSFTRRDRSNFTSVGSAEALRQGSTPWDTYRDTPGNDYHAQQKKILSFSNPFDPNKIHSEAPAFQRRWVHVFPTNKRGVAFQTHHETTEGQSRNLEVTAGEFPWKKSPSGSAAGTPQMSTGRRGILKQSRGKSPGEGGGLDGGSRSGSFRSEKGQGHSLGKTRGSPVSLSPGEGQRGGGKRNRGLLPANGSSIGNRDSPVSEPGSRVLTPSSSRQTSAANTPDLHRRQRWSEPLSNAVENFSSVRRTGVDWTSLVKPAHLPVTTDFYPAKEILDRDYAQYNTSLVVFREEQELPRESSGTSGGGGGGSKKRSVFLKFLLSGGLGGHCSVLMFGAKFDLKILQK